jgi:hypothetical protein
MRILCSPNTDITPVHITIDMESRLVLKTNLAGKSLSFSILARISRQNSYRTFKSSGFRAWTNWSLYGFISKRLRRILETVVCGSCNSQLAQRTDFCGLRWKQARTWSIVASDRVPTRTLAFANAPFLLEFLVSGVNGYSAGWFHVKLSAKCTLHSCYRLFLR